jgi:hypothetical protein
MNITVRFKVDDDTKSPVTALMTKLAELDVDVIEIFSEADRVKPNPGPLYRGGDKTSDVASATSAAVRREVQNG